MPDRCVTGSVILIQDRERLFTNKAINVRFSVIGSTVEMLRLYIRFRNWSSLLSFNSTFFCNVTFYTLISGYWYLGRNCYIHIRAYFLSFATRIHSSCASSFSALLCRPNLIAGNSHGQCCLCVAGSLGPISPPPDIQTTLTMLLTLSQQIHNFQSSLKC